MWPAVISRSLFLFYLCYRAKSHNSLTNLGILAAFVTGVAHCIHPWSVYIVLLSAFYLSATKFTKYKAEVKKTLTVSSSQQNNIRDGSEGPRNHIQVLSNSIVASLMILLHYFTGKHYDILAVGVIAQYAAVTGDTWSSELGILSKSPPILITTMRPCPKGTNGGVSPLGLLVALLAGLYIGSIAVMIIPIFEGIWYKLTFVLFMGFCGLFGSVFDSIIGALFQKSVVNKQGKIVESEGGFKLRQDNKEGIKIYSGSVDLLSNNQVNLATALVTSILGMIGWQYLF
jgi:uncharacterized protein (TIGR00297 family)